MIHPLQSRFEGYFYDGQSPLRRPAELELAEDGIRISPAGSAPRVWPERELRVPALSAGEPCRLERLGGPTGECIVVASPQFVEALRQHMPQLKQDRTLLEQLPVQSWVAASAACVLALGFVSYFWGLGWPAAIVARFTPLGLEERLGLAAAGVLAPAPQRCSDSAREQQLAGIVDRLAEATGSPYRFRVLYVRDARVNAFAAPGGYIVVHDGLLRMAETAEEFAGVLAHEMEHVLKQHGTRALARELPGRTLLSLVSADAAGTPAAREAGAALINRRHRLSEEEEADLDSVPLLLRARVEPNGLARFLRRIQGALGSFEYAEDPGSHPGTLERAAKLDAEAKRWPANAEPLMAISDWEDARNVCASPVPKVK